MSMQAINISSNNCLVQGLKGSVDLSIFYITIDN